MLPVLVSKEITKSRGIKKSDNFTWCFQASRSTALNWVFASLKLTTLAGVQTQYLNVELPCSSNKIPRIAHAIVMGTVQNRYKGKIQF